MPNEVNYLFEIDSEEINKMKKTIIENKDKLRKIVIFVIVLYVYILILNININLYLILLLVINKYPKKAKFIL